MTARAVAFLSDAALERSASELIREHEQVTHKSVTLPVPVDAILEKTLKLQIVWVEIEEQPGEIILARLDPDFHGRPTVQMNERRIKHFEAFFGTEPFSKAHEGGHWVLHYQRGALKQPLGWNQDAPGGGLPCRLLGDEDRRELQAERFAAYLLLPEHLLEALPPSRELCSWGAIANLARQCGVSRTAMARRLEQLGKLLVGPRRQLAAPSGPPMASRR